MTHVMYSSLAECGIIYDSRDSSRQLAPSPSLYYSLTHAHRSIGYHNLHPHLLTESDERLMYLRVYDNRDISNCTQVLWFVERLTRPTVSCCAITRTRRTIFTHGTQCVRDVLDPPVSTFSLSLYRHPFLYTLLGLTLLL
jgi:hypothetical protein